MSVPPGFEIISEPGSNPTIMVPNELVWNVKVDPTATVTLIVGAQQGPPGKAGADGSGAVVEWADVQW